MKQSVVDNVKIYNVDESQIVKCCKNKVLSAGSYNNKRLKQKYIDGTVN